MLAHVGTEADVRSGGTSRREVAVSRKLRCGVTTRSPSRRCRPQWLAKIWVTKRVALTAAAKSMIPAHLAPHSYHSLADAAEAPSHAQHKPASPTSSDPFPR